MFLNDNNKHGPDSPPHLTGSSSGSPAGVGSGFIPFRFPAPDDLPLSTALARVRCVFQTAPFGNMALGQACGSPEETQAGRERRKSLPKLLGFREWVELKQVHGKDMAIDPEPSDPSLEAAREADGSCTRTPGLALCVKTADCQPVLLAHKDGAAVAALHVGWRGNAIEFIQSGVRAFCRAYGLLPKDVLAVRGPSLGPSEAEFVNFSREWPDKFRHWFNPRSKRMNLWALTRAQLAEAGLEPDNIYGLDLCTRLLADEGTFFSYRAGHTGRQVSLIWIAPE